MPHQANKPHWWTSEHDTSWDRVKAAIRRNWEETKQAFTQPDPSTGQDVDDTVPAAESKEAVPRQGQPKFDDLEPAFRYGYAARRHYGQQSPEWDEDMERRLASEWGTLYPTGIGWDYYRNAVRAGWEYDEQQGEEKKAA
jgi:hypothetical protein